jgi:hemoglobin/transferrin/lactoferrin receptor protein
VWDTIWSYKPMENLTLRFAVNNILDQRYFKFPFGTTYNTNPGLTATFTNCACFSNPLELQTQAGRTFRVGATVEW